MKPSIVLKEVIPSLQFSPNEVLKSSEQICLREKSLHLAMKMGNAIQHKVIIIFQDISGIKQVETTIWFANSQHVVLKGGVIIPAKSIISIIL